MKRYEHFLFRHHPGSWPRAVLCVSVDVQWRKSGRGNNVDSGALQRWNTALVHRQEGDYAAGGAESGTLPAAFWETVRRTLGKGGSVWILSDNSRTALASLGAWEMIERGELRPSGTDGNGGLVRQDGSPAKRSPLLILEDPPLILQLQLRGVKGKITWVDAANYGLDLSTRIDGDGSTAAALAVWFVSAAKTLESLGPCGWRPTAAGQAMHLYRSAYLHETILSHTHRSATALESAALAGGRNEAYQLGQIGVGVHFYDFRSMYPYIYATERMPVRLVRYMEGESASVLAGESAGLYRIAEVAIESDAAFYPWRCTEAHAKAHAKEAAGRTPGRRVEAGEIYYPVGRYITTLCEPELALALSHGHVQEIKRISYYRSATALKGYAEALFAARRAALGDGDALLNDWLKRLLNSLWGRFAQRDRRWVTRIGADPIYQWGEWYAPLEGHGICRWRSVGGCVQVLKEGEYASGVVPAIAAAVCSAGRVRLLRAMLACGLEEVLYCDSDSIICTDSGAESLTHHGWIRPTEMGWLRELWRGGVAEIYGLKHYRIGPHLRCAGYPGGGPEWFREHDEQLRTRSVKESMRAKERPTSERRPVPYSRGPGRYDFARGAGGRVKPLEVWEW